MFQHEATGRTTFVELGEAEVFAELNPRLQKVCPLYKHPQPAVPEVDEVVFDMLKAAQGACKLGLKGYANTYIQNAIDLLSAGKGEQNDV